MFSACSLVLILPHHLQNSAECPTSLIWGSLQTLFSKILKCQLKAQIIISLWCLFILHLTGAFAL
uniref:Uncharacterized protein n=1 Tax=Moniliophthora roreri TaxID=221103 RepID=A0A0W0F5K1_MONRR